MAGSFNSITLVGNLTRDPEIRHLQNGAAVTKFAIAVNRKTKKGDEVTFIDIVAWDNGNYKLAETCSTYLKKGMSVLVMGRLVIRSYDDKDGNKRKATEVVIETMQMLDKAPAGSNGSNGRGNAANGDDEYDEPSYDEAPPVQRAAPSNGKSSNRTATKTRPAPVVQDEDESLDDIPF